MSTTQNVAAKLAALLDRVDKLTAKDDGKATTFNVATRRRAEAIAAEEAAAIDADPFAGESAWLDDSF